MNLTDEQSTVVDSTAQNILVVAGPGSGKTATTVARIVRLLKSGIDPRKIVALTFTNAAARELESRLDAQFREISMEHATEFWTLGYVGTLHGFALKMLKVHGTGIGFGERLALIGEDAAEELMAARAKSLGCKTPVNKLMKLKGEAPDRRKTTKTRLTPEELVVRSYYADLGDAGLVDFDTILLEFQKLVFLRQMPSTYSHLFVDEVQDSAVMDWSIYLDLPIANKFYVGDEDQSIYGFRGGRPDLMHEHAPDARFLLQSNFRSFEEICTVANNLIRHTAGERFDKETISTRGKGGGVGLAPMSTNAGEETGLILHAIRAETERGTPYDEMAVLARTNAICSDIRQQLKASGIPISEKSKDVNPFDWLLAKSLIELAVNPYNDVLAYFFLVARDGSGLAEAAKRNAQSAMKPLAEVAQIPFSKAGIAGVGQLLAENGMSTETRMRVGSIIRGLPDTADLLELALAMTYDLGTAEAATPGVVVTTIHQAKGREWDAVILAGMEEEVMVSNSSIDPASETVDEARRLCYVAVTRARDNLYLTSARWRKTSWGRLEEHRPCRFLKEMGL